MAKSSRKPVEEKITQLTPKVLRQLAMQRKGTEESSKITDLDFSKGYFDLESLDGLKFVSWENIKVIDASNNRIDRIDDVLNKFPTISTISLNNNYISYINLILPNLTELDLSQNELRSLPDLSQVPCLKVLICYYNHISSGLDQLKWLRDLEVLDISKNEIALGPQDFKKLLDIMNELRKLASLAVFENPLCRTFPNYQLYFVKGMKNLAHLDGEAISEDVRKAYQKEVVPNLEEMGREQQHDHHQTAQQSKFSTAGPEDAKSQEMPSLRKLHQYLRSTKTQPQKSIEKVKKLAIAVEKIVTRPQERFFLFRATTAEEQGEIRMAIDSFLQESVLIIEDLPTLRNPILRIIGNLSEVSEANVGQKCLLVIQDLVDSGPDIAKDAKAVVGKVIIPKLMKNKLQDIAKDLLIGVIKLFEAHQLADRLFVLIDRMSNWIREEVRMEERKLIGLEDEDQEEIDHEKLLYGLNLVAVAANNEKNSLQMQQKGIPKQISMLIKLVERESEPAKLVSSPSRQSKMNAERLINILNIIEYTAVNDESACEVYVAQEIHQKILRDIFEYLMIYKANGHTFGSKSVQERNENELLYIKLLSSHVDCLTGLCRDQRVVDYMFKDSFHIRDELLNVSLVPLTDPVLLTSIIALINGVLINSSEQVGPDMVYKVFSDKLQKFLQLMPFLGGRKYPEICMLGEKYSSGTMIGKDPIPCSSLTNHVLHKLFIQIIKIIEIYSAGSVEGTGELQTICEEVSTAMNRNMREDHLFNALDIPNDDVKLAVVQCLNRVPLEDLDTEEIGHVVRTIGTYKNLGVGRTEEVLAQIFLLTTKIAKHPTDGKEFRSKFGELVIADCLNILSSNQQRNLVNDEEENMEKTLLSMSCVLFLKTCSLFAELQPHLQNSVAQKFLRKILKSEERYPLSDDIPVDIERTWIGRNTEFILSCFNGQDHITVYQQVSFRAIQRIGDVLMGRSERDTPNPWKGEKDTLLDSLFEDMSHVAKRREQEEYAPWDECTSPDENMVFTPQLQAFFRIQHTNFVQSRGIEQILRFLMGTNSKEGYKVEKELEPEYNREYQKEVLLTEILEQTEIIDQAESDRLEKEKTLSKQEKGAEVKSTVKIQYKNILDNALQGFPNESSTAYYQYNIPRSAEGEGQMTEMSQKKSDQDNLRTRALSLSALLRCIYAAIEFSPVDQQRYDVIDQIKESSILRPLSMLCATTNWQYACLGAKYLRVMKHALYISPVELTRDQNDVNILEVVTLAIREILKAFQEKVQADDRFRLKREDKFLLSECANCAYIIVTSLGTFSWSDKVENRYEERISMTYKSVQDQVLAHILERLIPLDSIDIFVQMLMLDIKLCERFTNDSVRDEADLIWMDRARTSIVEMFGVYMGICDRHKYRILEFFKENEIFNHQKLRKSFMQNILEANKFALYKMELGKWMRTNYNMYNIPRYENMKPERIIFTAWVDCNVQGEAAWNKRLVVLSHRCFYLLRDSGTSPCTMCGAERFCPKGPRFVKNYLYADFVSIIKYDKLHQLAGVEIRNKSFGRESRTIYTFMFPFYNDAIDFIHILGTILQKSLNPDDNSTDYYLKRDVGLSNDVEEFLHGKGYGNLETTIFCAVNSGKDFSSSARQIKNGKLCVVTSGKQLSILDFNMKRWQLIPPKYDSQFDDTPNGIDEEEQKHPTGRLIKEYLSFEVGEIERINLTATPEAKCILSHNRKETTFMFGDDLSCEIFQRNIFRKRKTMGS